jgi:hypothetical protein
MQTTFTYTHKKKHTINTALTENETVREILTLNKDYLYSHLNVWMKARLNLYLTIAKENYSGRNYLNGSDIFILLEMLGYEIDVTYTINAKPLVI